MNKFSIYFLFIFVSLGFAGFVLSQGMDDVSYPIAELGNCQSKQACANYCDQSENTASCLNFAEEQDLMDKEDIDIARKLLEAGKTSGPGGCKTNATCEVYCNVPANMGECIKFAKENGLMSSEEMEEADMVLAAIDSGVTPPPCKGKKACDSYCSDPSNIEQCMAFAEAAGLVSPKEAEMIRKTGGKGPGGCVGKDACDNFCQSEANMEECINFAIQYDLMPAEEAADAQRALQAIKSGAKMPNCRGKDECDSYCSQPDNAEECINFAVAGGFMSAEEAETAKKMAASGLMGGPGGCKGQKECEDFCNDPANMDECMDFAVKSGMMTQEEADKAKMMGGPGGFSGGPGGCQSQAECEQFCSIESNREECMNFAVQNGMMSEEEIQKAQVGIGGQQGPGGCQSPEDCKSYCNDPSHNEECMSFGGGQSMPPDGGQGMQPGISDQGFPGQVPDGTMPEGFKPSDGQFPEGMMPEGMTQPPSAEEIQRIQEQMMQDQIRMEEQIMQQMQQAPPQEEPQSLFDQGRLMMGSLFDAFKVRL